MRTRSVVADRLYYEQTGVLPPGADAKAVSQLDPANVRRASYNILGSSYGWRRASTLQLKRLAERYGVPWPVPRHGKIDKQQKGELIQACYAVRQQRKHAKLYQTGATFKMAARIFEKFGGVWGLVNALESLPLHSGDEGDRVYARSYNTVRTWPRPKAQKGRDGMIPPNMWQPIMRAARYQGLVLTAEDFLPELFDGSTVMGPSKRPSGAPPKKPFPTRNPFDGLGEDNP